MPLGMFHELDFSATRLHLEAGDTMFLYTDGLSEARHGDDEYGFERVAHLVRQQATRPASALITTLPR